MILKNIGGIFLVFLCLMASTKSFGTTQEVYDVELECLKSIGTVLSSQNKATCAWLYESIMTQVHVTSLLSYGITKDLGLESRAIYNNKFVIAELVYPGLRQPQVLARIGIPTATDANHYVIGTTALIHFSNTEVMSLDNMFRSMLRYDGNGKVKVFSLKPKDFLDIKNDTDAKNLFLSITTNLGASCLKATDMRNYNYILINVDSSSEKGFRIESFKGDIESFNENKCLDVSPGIY